MSSCLLCLIDGVKAVAKDNQHADDGQRKDEGDGIEPQQAGESARTKRILVMVSGQGQFGGDAHAIVNVILEWFPHGVSWAAAPSPVVMVAGGIRQSATVCRRSGATRDCRCGVGGAR